MSGSHTFTVGVQYLVCECGETLSDEESLRVHLAQVHPQRRLKLLSVGTKNTPPPVTEFRCGECGNIYPTEEECVSHQEADHIPYMDEDDYQEVKEEDIEDAIIPGIVFPSRSSPTPSPPPTKQPKKRKKRFNKLGQHCETCGKKFTSNTMIWCHRKLHSGVKEYKCKYCPKEFALPMYLEQHIRTHTGEKPYKCQKCPKAFSVKGNLLRHDLVHSGIKPFQCSVCGNSFTQSNSMKLHYLTVHLKLPPPYLSKKRRARIETREENPGGEETQEQLSEKHPYTNSEKTPGEVRYVKTAAGRKIALSNIVPKKIKEEALLQFKTEEAPPTDEQFGVIEEEVYTEDVPDTEEDVAYEVVIGTLGSVRQF